MRDSLLAGSVAFLFLLVPVPVSAQYVIDLSRSPGSITQSVVPGQALTVTLINLAPGASYDISVLRETIPIPPLDPKVLVSAERGGCDALTAARGLLKLKDEKEVAAAVLVIDEKRKDCADAEQREIDLHLGATRRLIDVGRVQAGEQVTITVTRKSDAPKSWILVLTGGPRGSVRVLYGVALGPGQTEKFFAKASTTAGEFIVTREREDANETGHLAAIPAAFFQWLPMTRELKDWAIGPALGLGVKTDRPAFFFGGIVTFNQNLGLVFGVPVYEELVLRGTFSEGQVIKENLTEDQLHKKAYRFQRVFFAGVFRFSSNPFGGGSGSREKQK